MTIINNGDEIKIYSYNFNQKYPDDYATIYKVDKIISQYYTNRWMLNNPNLNNRINIYTLHYILDREYIKGFKISKGGRFKLGNYFTTSKGIKIKF